MKISIALILAVLFSSTQQQKAANFTGCLAFGNGGKNVALPTGCPSCNITTALCNCPSTGFGINCALTTDPTKGAFATSTDATAPKIIVVYKAGLWGTTSFTQAAFNTFITQVPITTAAAVDQASLDGITAAFWLLATAASPIVAATAYLNAFNIASQIAQIAIIATPATGTNFAAVSSQVGIIGTLVTVLQTAIAATWLTLNLAAAAANVVAKNIVAVQLTGFYNYISAADSLSDASYFIQSQAGLFGSTTVATAIITPAAFTSNAANALPVQWNCQQPLASTGAYQSSLATVSDPKTGLCTFVLPTGTLIVASVVTQTVGYNNTTPVKSGSKLMIAAVLMTVLSLLTL